MAPLNGFSHQQNNQNNQNYEHPPQSPQHPHIQTAPALPTRITYILKLWTLKLASDLGFLLLRLLKPMPKSQRPSLLKTYACRPNIRNRIFIPRTQNKTTGQNFPLYIDLHSGGFALCDAEFDDSFCADFANTFDVIVVSIDYSRAPTHRFPAPTTDIIALTQAILSDTDLPIDRDRVVLGGFSAGGNLALSAGQDEAMINKIRGIVSWYPVTDFTLTPREKQRSRPYRNSEDLDDLKDWGPVFEWGYIPSGQDLKDPRVSVRFIGKQTPLPKWVFVIGAQYDMLCNEAKHTIFDIAGLNEEERQLGHDGFEKETYKWRLVKGVRHGFTHELGGSKDEDEVVRKKRRQEMFEEVGKWLFDGPFRVGGDDDGKTKEGRSFEICGAMEEDKLAAAHIV